jgi:Domain of Unknown Function (DUF1080)
MLRVLLVLVILASPLAAADTDRKPNTLTPEDVAEGWLLLFDGATKFGWKVSGDVRATDGTLVLQNASVTTTSQFGGFELEMEYQGAGQVKLVTATSSGGIGLAQEGKWGALSMHLTAGAAGAELESTVQTQPDGRQVTICKGTSSSGHNRIELDAHGHRLMVRNVKLRPVGLKSIFDGKDLTGWREVKTDRTKSEFSVTKDGWLNIKNGPGDIQSEGEWDDFVLQIEVYSNGDHLNSGVFFRCIPGQFWSGYEAQIRNQWQDNDRSKPIDYGTGGIYNRQPARKVVSSDREWFTMTVTAAGKHMAVWVNGYQAADFTDPRPPNESARKGSKTAKGPISLQGHDPTTDLSFRNIRIAGLPK